VKLITPAMRQELKALFERACSLIAQVAPAITESSDLADLQPWLMLHFNCAIIATRTQQPDLNECSLRSAGNPYT